MPSYRNRGRMAQQMEDLLRHYRETERLGGTTANDILEIALDDLWNKKVGILQAEPPHIVGWDEVLLARPAVCADTGRDLPAGTRAYREIWSDGREGDILSKESLVADGILDA